MAYRKPVLKGIAESWRTQSWAIRVLRLWLGATWFYAGWDKASDASFLDKDATTYIGQQLISYSQNSPIDWFFNSLIEHASTVGLFVIFSEFAIGLATLLWIAPTSAAFGGFAMSIVLWLASTWQVSPYFLGSDTAYAVMWLVYFLTLVGNRRTVDISLDRRGAIRLTLISAAAVGSGLIAKVFTSKSEAANSSGPIQIIKVADLAVGKTHQFALSNGMPAIVFRTKSGVFAYSATCTHEGCTVSYRDSNKSLYCPCHGAEFDPFSNGGVISGPTQAALPPVKVKIDGDWVVQI